MIVSAFWRSGTNELRISIALINIGDWLLCWTIRKGSFRNANGYKLPSLPIDGSVSNRLKLGHLA